MNEYNNENIFSKRLRAGKRRTYFFDVRTTKNNDYFVTLTESKKRYDGDGYDRHKIFLYKEDFNKFIDALNETINHVKTELMPDFDFDAFNHDEDDNYLAPNETSAPASEEATNNEAAPTTDVTIEEVEVKNEIAEELGSATGQASFAPEQNSDNPSASDEAQTW